MSFNPRIKAGERRYPTAANSAQAAAASAVIATGPGTLNALFGYSATEQYIQIHDAAALPANGVNCLVQVKVLADNWYFFDMGDGGMRFFNGLCVCNSTTAFAKTLGAADCSFVSDYALKA